MMAELTPQQRAVVENRGGTLLVSAAAGSGKTKVLVDRVVERIRREGKNIHEFLIITFTNAAAAELRSKISVALSKALAAEPDNRHLRRQLNLMHLAQISTVHAFCGALIRQYGYLLEVPPDYAMLEDARKEEMLTRILSDMLEAHYADITPAFRQLSDTLGAGRSDSDLEKLVRALFERMLTQPNPQQWLRNLTLELEEAQEPGNTVFGRILLDNARQRLGWLIDRHTWATQQMQGDEKLTKKFLPAYENQTRSLEAIVQALDGPWDQIAPLLELEYPRLVVQKYPEPEKLKAIQAIRKDMKKQLETMATLFSRPGAELLSEQNKMAPALHALCDLASELERKFSAEKRRKNLLDFSDQEHLAIHLLVDSLGRPTDVAKEVSQRYAEIMVDEYQDSNRVQELIYTAIVRGQDENRFLVGDVKQSIYGFRQAEPALFLEKYRSYAPADQAAEGEPRKLILSKNFRSRPEILEAVNHTFSCIMSPEVGELSYGPDESLYPGLPEYPKDGSVHVSLSLLDLPKKSSGSAEDSDQEDRKKAEKEAAWAAHKIVSLLDSGLTVRDGDTIRAAQPKDIAILFRARTSMNIYQKALLRAGIPVAGDAGGNLFETPEVQVLLNLLRVLDNPHQDIPLLAVLCSPLYRISNDQLGMVRASSHQPRFYDAMTECREDWCVQTLNSLESLRKKAAETSADELVWALLEDTGLLGAYSAMEQGQRRRANLLRIYDIARETAGGSYLYLYELIRTLDRLEQSGTEGDPGSQEGVTLTTIHKSKGLEYPIVFLCDLTRKFNFEELKSSVLLDGDLGIGAKIIDPERRIRYPGLCHQALDVKKRSQLTAEEMRVLYVAMTRPKDYLFMSCCEEGLVGTLSKLLPGVGCPAEQWAVRDAKSPGEWVLLSALSRIEAGKLFAICGRPQCQLTMSDHPWQITYEMLETVPEARYVPKTEQTVKASVPVPSPEQLVTAMEWQYPYLTAAQTPSKVTATELKGRAKDQEAQEDAAAPRRMPRLSRPEFILERKGLSPTEQGTAAHQFLQYANFTALTTQDGVISELDRMVDEEFLTEAQAQAVRPEEITGLFTSPLGKRMLSAKELLREFKFSLLTDAERIYPGLESEQVLLQGVVDAAILEDDGITVIDFKTDRVSPEQTEARAQNYRGQLETYRDALARIFGKPVKQTVLYFLKPGKEVIL